MRSFDDGFGCFGMAEMVDVSGVVFGGRVVEAGTSGVAYSLCWRSEAVSRHPLCGFVSWQKTILTFVAAFVIMLTLLFL